MHSLFVTTLVHQSLVLLSDLPRKLAGDKNLWFLTLHCSQSYSSWFLIFRMWLTDFCNFLELLSRLLLNPWPRIFTTLILWRSPPRCHMHYELGVTRVGDLTSWDRFRLEHRFFKASAPCEHFSKSQFKSPTTSISLPWVRACEYVSINLSTKQETGESGGL